VPQLKRGVSPATRASAGTDDERERWSRVLVLDDRSAVGAGAAPPHEEHCATRRDMGGWG
jgi:hypothetical protein